MRHTVFTSVSTEKIPIMEIIIPFSMVLLEFNEKKKTRKNNYKNNKADLEGVCSILVRGEILGLTTTYYSDRTSETEK